VMASMELAIGQAVNNMPSAEFQFYVGSNLSTCAVNFFSIGVQFRENF
jgi:hypothetical protein